MSVWSDLGLLSVDLKDVQVKVDSFFTPGDIGRIPGKHSSGFSKLPPYILAALSAQILCIIGIIGTDMLLYLFISLVLLFSCTCKNNLMHSTCSLELQD